MKQLSFEFDTPITITLQKIRDAHPCPSGWEKLLKAKAGVGMDAEFPLSDVLDSNGLDDTLWCLHCLPEHDNLWRLYAVWCARQVKHLMKDQRSIDALDVAERYARGLATDAEIDAARAAARAAADAAADAARAASDAAWAAAWAAWAAARDAWAARDAAWGAARAAAEAAADAAWGAEMAAAGAAAWAAQAASGAAAGAAQGQKLREILTRGEW
jgi:hypothetical protein